MTYNKETILYGGRVINTHNEIIHGENGITIYEDDVHSYYIPYTSITLITTTKEE